MSVKIYNKGFSLVELLVVMAVLGILASIGAPISYRMYTSYSFDAEEKILIASLREARNTAYANYNENSHGLHIDNDAFVIFEGDSYATRVIANDRIMDRNSDIVISGPNEIIFASLTGFTTDESYTISAYQGESIISVNKYGNIELQ